MSLMESLADVLMPRYCKVCGCRLSIGEEHLCAPCTLKMPLLPYSRDCPSRTEALLLSELRLVRAASYFRYDKESDYRKILYHLKYYGHPAVGFCLARRAAVSLSAEGFFEGIDYIVPVPLSRRKKRKRGYNQCDYIARGIQSVTGLEIRCDVVARTVSNQVQAKKGRLQRWLNAEGIFAVSDAGALDGSHVLVVDDVATTGATIMSLMDVMTASADVRISVFTLALAE